MKRSKFAAAGVVVLLAVGGTSLAACSSDGASSESQTSEVETTAPPVTAGADPGTGGGYRGPAESSDPSQPGRYVDYSPELISSTPGDKLLFFHAPWCPQCQELEADIEESGLPDGVTVFKVDYDSNQDLREQYGVTIQTTMVKVDDQGEAIDSYVAYEDPTFANVSDALLK